MNEAKKVVITSANCFTAGLLIPKLKAKGYHTTGLLRRPTKILTDEVITDWMNSETAVRALQKADYIIHLSGEINAKKEAVYIQANLATTRIVAEAAKTGSAWRLIFLSYPGANPHHKNHYLRYKGEAEILLCQTTKEVVIFRCPIIIDAPDKPSRIDTLFISKNSKAVPVIGNGEQTMHPVYRGDVVDIILAALDQGEPGVYELSGPEKMTTNNFIRLVNQNPSVKIAHTPGWLARLLSPFIKGLSPVFVDILLHFTDSEYRQKTYADFGITPTSITNLWSRKKSY